MKVETARWIKATLLSGKYKEGQVGALWDSNGGCCAVGALMSELDIRFAAFGQRWQQFFDAVPISLTEACLIADWYNSGSSFADVVALVEERLIDPPKKGLVDAPKGAPNDLRSEGNGSQVPQEPVYVVSGSSASGLRKCL